MGESKRSVTSTDRNVHEDTDGDSSDSEYDENFEDTSDSDGADAEAETEDVNNDDTNAEEEEEDEVIKAIRRESQKQRDHPPVIHCEDFVTDISFHPHEDIIGIANVVGDVLFYRYTFEDNTLMRTLELHTKACRDIEFSHDGKILYSAAKDKTIMLSDVESGRLIKYYEEAHTAPIYCLACLDENLFATGDDDGCVKLWDFRTNESLFILKKNEDYISDITTNEAKKYLLCSSGDGSLTTMDLHNRKFVMQSEEYDDEITCLGLFRTETKLLAGTSKGKLLLYNWNEFGLHSDLFPGPKCSINDLIPITENIVVTACEDGNLRAIHLFPHRHLGIVGQHELSVENVDICNNGRFIASSSHNNDVKFWNIQYFEDFEKVSNKHKKHSKKREMENNLPSSKIRNASDFFKDLC